MMQHYFGLSTVEVAARRRMTGINIRQGAVQRSAMTRTRHCGASGKSRHR